MSHANAADEKKGTILNWFWTNDRVVYCLVLVFSSVVLFIYFNILGQTNPNTSRYIVIENMSQTSSPAEVWIAAISSNYFTVPLNSIQHGQEWELVPKEKTAFASDMLVSKVPGARLTLSLQKGYAKILFGMNPESGQVSIADRDQNSVQNVNLESDKDSYYTYETSAGYQQARQVLATVMLVFAVSLITCAFLLYGLNGISLLWTKSRYLTVSAAYVLLALLAHNLYATSRIFLYGDSAWYWNTSNLFFKNGSFAFQYYSQNTATFRGYFLPFLSLLAIKSGSLGNCSATCYFFANT